MQLLLSFSIALKIMSLERLIPPSKSRVRLSGPVQGCQPSRRTAGDGGPSEICSGRTGRRQGRPSRPYSTMTA